MNLVEAIVVWVGSLDITMLPLRTTEGLPDEMRAYVVVWIIETLEDDRGLASITRN